MHVTPPRFEAAPLRRRRAFIPPAQGSALLRGAGTHPGDGTCALLRGTGTHPGVGTCALLRGAGTHPICGSHQLRRGSRLDRCGADGAA